ncbi:MAG TPA: hypothetical protein VIL60_02405 [Rhodanobacter sp.]
MAQMTRKYLTFSLCALLASGSALAGDIPPGALAAEARQDWPAAAQVYREFLQAHPDDVAAWRRLSDVEARRGQASAAADALGHAANLRPGDAALQATYSRALATAQRPAEALQAIGRALALAPDNVDNLIAQARLANWTGDAELARRSLARVQQLDPQRHEVLADLARSAAWRGDLGQGITLMRSYLASFPQDKAASLDLARFLSWQGNYAGADAQLADYRTRFGEDEHEIELRARVLAWANRRHQALALNTPLLLATPDDYGRNYTQVIALRQSFIPQQALPYLAAVQRLQPDSKETDDLARSTATRVQSRINLPILWSEDSDRIAVTHAHVGIDWNLTPHSTLLLEAGWNRYRAPLSSPFAAPGSNHVKESRGLVGVRHALGTDYAVQGLVGVSSFDHGGGSTGIGSLSLLASPSDQWRWSAGVERDRVGVSPLAASMGLSRNGATAAVRWTPDLSWTVDIDARHDRYSDANRRDEIAFAARRAVIRNGRISLDLGAAGQWQGFDRDPGHGYYAPSSYRRFALTGGAYIRFTDEVGLSLQAMLGTQKDENLPRWKSANDFNTNLTVGIFHTWRLHVRAGYTQRRQASGGYSGRYYGLDLQHDF